MKTQAHAVKGQPKWIPFAFNVTAAHLLTLDFMDVTSAEVLRHGLPLTDRSSKREIVIHSLQDLQLGKSYSTSRGTKLRRTSTGTIMLGDRIELTLDGSRVVPDMFVIQDDAMLAQNALMLVQSLRADPKIETLVNLERTLISVSSSASWLESFLKLDGIGALLDVLSHSQSRFTQRDTDEQVQIRCVSCVSILVRRGAALSALLSHPHAITCMVAALDVRAPSAQEQVVEVSHRCVPERGGGPRWCARHMHARTTPHLTPAHMLFALAPP